MEFASFVETEIYDSNDEYFCLAFSEFILMLLRQDLEENVIVSFVE
jgi:hypothetical protein